MDKELQKILDQLKRLGASTSQVEKLRKVFSDSKISAKDLENAVASATVKVNQLQEASEFTNESFRDLSAILKQNEDALAGKNSGLKDSLKFSRGLISLAQKLQAEEEGITTLSQKELQNIVDQAEIKRDGLADALKNLAVKAESLRLDEQGYIIGQDGRKLAGAALNSHLKSLQAKGQITSLESDALKFKQSGLIAEEGFVQKAKDRLELEKSINDTMGLSGDAVRSLGGIMKKVGLESKIVEDAVKKSEKAMRETAKEGSMLQTALSGLPALGKGFALAITDPASIMSGIVSSFMRVNKAQVETIRLTGTTTAAFNDLSGRVSTTSEVLQTAAEATRALGIDAIQAFGPKLLSNITYARHELGLSGDETARLGQLTSLNGLEVKEVNKAISEGASEMNTFAKTGVPVGVVLHDVLTASEDITASLGNNPKAIAAAATAARGLGLTLGRVNSIADSLLDFESSISNELEASLLLGRNINLNKARELALNNDIEGVALELSKHGASAAEFANMNRVQQNALAKAMSMSREELGRMVMAQKQSALLSDEERANIAGITVEQLKAEDIQHRLNRAMQQLGESFAPMLEAIVPMVKGLVIPISYVADRIALIFKKIDELIPATEGFGLAFKNVANFLAGGAIIASISAIRGALTGTFSTSLVAKFFKGLSTGFAGIRKNIAATFGKKLKDSVTDKGGDIAKNTGDNLKKVKDNTKGANKAQGPGGFLKSLAEGLREMGKDFVKIAKGTLALGLAAVAVVGPFAGALLIIKDVDPATIAAFSLGVGVLGTSLAVLGKMSSNVIKGGIALAAAGAGILAASYGFSLLEGVNPDVIKAVVGSLLVLGTGAAVLGALSGSIITGAAALGILGLAMVPAAFALSLLENVDISKIVAFSTALPLLGLAAAGLGFISPLIFAGSLAIGALGLSLIPLAGAFALLGAVNVEGILGQLGSFATMAPGLLIGGAGLLGLSAGLIAFSAAMTGASILGGLTSLFGGGVMGDLQALTAMAGPLAQVGVSLTAIAAGISGIALALSQLETAKIDELKGLVMSTAIAAPMVAASGAITDLITGITGGGSQDSSNKELLAEIKLLRAAVESGGDVFIDGNKAGNLISMAAYKTA